MDTENTVETEAAEKKDRRCVNGGGDKSKQAVREAMDRLIGAVDVDNYDVNEYDVLGRIMVRAGLMWRCVSPSCRGINHTHSPSCDNCGVSRPKARETPKADYFI